MSFRNRLTLFFLLIVVLPTVAVALVLFRLVATNETGKADARVGEARAAAAGLFGEASRAAKTTLDAVAADTKLTQALSAGDQTAATSRARTLAREVGALRIVVRRTSGVGLDVGDRRAIAPFAAELTQTNTGAELGKLSVSIQSAADFAQLVKKVTGLDVVVARGDEELVGTVAGRPAKEFPSAGEVRLGSDRYRVASFTAGDFGPMPLRVSVLGNSEAVSDAIHNDRLLVGGALVGFLALALIFAAVVARALQGQIGRLIEAARRLGRGDFSTSVPTGGDREFASLAEEFNRMSDELERRIDELGHERTRLERTVRRIGQSFASSLDRERVLEIVVSAAVDGVGADYGRAATRASANGVLQERAHIGALGRLERAVATVEAQALERGEPAELADGAVGALAFPLVESEGVGGVLGVVTVVRAERPFTEEERELFHYLAAQAALSIENVDLHERVQRQAVTDELTGLSNHRRFQEVMDAEIERAKRFQQDLGLVLLDIDDFKQVNDTYGHQQGDRVLREVARVVRENSREIDDPARYGGEELAVALPQTDLDGAFQLAERMRHAIEGIEVPVIGNGGRLKVTASFGVAALPVSATDKGGLIAAADAALYAAKRAGKNTTVRAQ